MIREISVHPRPFYLALILIIVFAMAARTPLDSDMWWHLRAGQETWTTATPMTVDTFSHTRYGETWINHSWLSQVGMYLLFEHGSYLALTIAVAALAALSMALVYAQMQAPHMLRAFIIVLAAAVAGVVWSPRPQLVSLVLFGLLAYLLYLYKWKSRDRLWLLPFIFVLWSNLHGGYALGLLLLGAMIAGEILNHLLGYSRISPPLDKGGQGGDSHPTQNPTSLAKGWPGGDSPQIRNPQSEIRNSSVLPWGSILKLSLISILSFLVVAINPNGLAMWAIPFQTVGVEALQQFISEWASPDFHQFFQQPFLWLLLFTMAAIGLSSRRLDGTDLVTFVGFAYLGFIARRNFGPFAMVAAPILARHLWPALMDWNARLRPTLTAWKVRFPLLSRLSSGRQLPSVVVTITNAVILGLLLLVAGGKAYAVSTPTLVEAYERQLFPVDAVEWLRANQPPGELFNSYNYGGYLIWHLPEYPVFVDGRTDLFGDELLMEYLEISSGRQGWQENFEQYGINLVLVEAGSILSRELNYFISWSQAYNDEIVNIFVTE
jgi:hypothetical protein